MASFIEVYERGGAPGADNVCLIDVDRVMRIDPDAENCTVLHFDTENFIVIRETYDAFRKRLAH